MIGSFLDGVDQQVPVLLLLGLLIQLLSIPLSQLITVGDSTLLDIILNFFSRLEEIGTRIVTDCGGSEGEVQVVRSVGNKTKE